ncbi:hypothetical protein OG21DRAFT_1491987 [Imleria badia]|nr:hypothetical protein OG21DRAFT_1491987 [Imleria badia]
MKAASDADLKDLIDWDKFDFMLAFAGSAMISNYINGAISQAIEGVSMDKTDGIWGAPRRWWAWI